MTSVFNPRRYLALLFSICAALSAWYTLVLINNKDSYFPSHQQIIGLPFALGVSIIIWLRNCFVIDFKK